MAWGVASSSYVTMGDLGRGCCAGRIDAGQHEILAIGSRSLSICRAPPRTSWPASSGRTDARSAPGRQAVLALTCLCRRTPVSHFVLLQRLRLVSGDPYGSPVREREHGHEDPYDR